MFFMSKQYLQIWQTRHQEDIPCLRKIFTFPAGISCHCCTPTSTHYPDIQFPKWSLYVTNFKKIHSWNTIPQAMEWYFNLSRTSWTIRQDSNKVFGLWWAVSCSWQGMLTQDSSRILPWEVSQQCPCELAEYLSSLFGLNGHIDHEIILYSERNVWASHHIGLSKDLSRQNGYENRNDILE